MDQVNKEYIYVDIYSTLKIFKELKIEIVNRVIDIISKYVYMVNQSCSCLPN